MKGGQDHEAGKLVMGAIAPGGLGGCAEALGRIPQVPFGHTSGRHYADALSGAGALPAAGGAGPGGGAVAAFSFPTVRMGPDGL